MARTRISDKDVQDPSRLQDNLTNDYIEGNLDEEGISFYRAVVVEIDHKGGQLSGPGTKRDFEPKNPINSFRGRILNIDRFTDDEDLPIFWPIFPHDIHPIKEGEHADVIFEDDLLQHGVWICRIPEPKNSINIQPGTKKYKDNSDNDTSVVGIDQAVQDVDEKPKSINVSSEFVAEEVPDFEARVGDRVINGSNNARIVLGRDRKNASKDDGNTKEAGTIDLFAGKAVNGNLDSDQSGTSRIYISMKTDIDQNMGSDVGFDGQKDKTEVAAIGMKSDEIRIVAKENAKIVVGGGDGSKVTLVMGTDGKLQIEAANEVTIKCDKINLGGENLTENVILGTTFLTQLQTLLTTLSVEFGGLGTFFGIPGVAHPGAVSAIGTFLGLIESFKSQVTKTK